MGRAPCCDKASVKKGPWAPEEDEKLKEYIDKNGTVENWIALPQKAGLKRCGKSCRLRWLNYLRPNIKHGEFSDDEDSIICTLFASIGSRWSVIAGHLPGRTDNDIKNYWNTKLKKKLMGIMSPSSSSLIKKPFPYQSSLTFPALSLHHQGHNSNFTSPYFTAYDHPISISSTPTSFFESQEGYNLGCSDSLAYSVGPLSTRVKYECPIQIQQGCGSNSEGSSNNSTTTTFGYDQSLGGLQNYCSYKGVDESSEKTKGNYGESDSLDCSLEEIKQLISTNHCSNNLNFFVDEIKAEEKVMYY